MPAQRSTSRTTRTTSNNSSSKSTGTSRAPRVPRQEVPFRSVDVLAELFVAIEGVSGDFSLMACPRCAVLIPSSDKAQTTHRKFHDQIDGLDQRAS